MGQRLQQATTVIQFLKCLFFALVRLMDIQAVGELRKALPSAIDGWHCETVRYGQRRF